MKKNLSVLTFIAALALIAQSCSFPFQYVGFEDGPQEDYPQGDWPEEEFPPEEVPLEEHPPEEMPMEEHPPEEEHPEEFGEAHIAFFEAHPPTIPAGDCAMVEWGVEGMAEVTLNGELVEPHGMRDVCPPGTTSYRLTVHAENGVQEREVTVAVENAGGAQPQPQPQPQPQQPKSQSQPQQPPLQTLPGADLALTDLYPDKLKNGTVYARITNHGPDKVTNLQMSFSCSWAKTGYGAAFGVNESVGPKQITIKSLNPGQTTPFNTSVKVDLTQYWYNMTCKIQVPFANLNTNSGNDSYTEKLAK